MLHRKMQQVASSVGLLAYGSCVALSSLMLFYMN
jgi:hypothetical protein